MYIPELAEGTRGKTSAFCKCRRVQKKVGKTYTLRQKKNPWISKDFFQYFKNSMNLNQILEIIQFGHFP